MMLCYKSYIWLLPFCFFALGYIGARFYMAPMQICMPSLVGMNSTQALILLSDYYVVPRIIAQKEENNVPHGTILQQTPAAGQTIKRRQSVFLVLSTTAMPPHMPHYIHMQLSDIQRRSKQENSALNIVYVPYSAPRNSCFAQWPSAGEALTAENPIVYIAAGCDQPVIWPNFVGFDAEDVLQFLKEHDITPDIICKHMNIHPASYGGYQVTEQRPLAGSYVYIDKPEHIMVQLRVE